MTWVFWLFLARTTPYNLGPNDASYPPGMEWNGIASAGIRKWRLSLGSLFMAISNVLWATDCINIFWTLWSLGNRNRNRNPRPNPNPKPISTVSVLFFSFALSVMSSARLACLFIYILYMTLSCFPCCFLNEISRLTCRQNKECINYPIPGGAA